MKSFLSSLAAILTLAAAMALASPPSPRSLVPADESRLRPGHKIPTGPEGQPALALIEGHPYPLVRVGAQTWLGENLLVRRDERGQELSDVLLENADPKSAGRGNLYTWDAARRAVPAGWRLPTVKDWQALIGLLGGERAAGRALLRTGPGGFGALLGGGVDVLGRAFAQKEQAIFWTSAEISVDRAVCLTIDRGGEIELGPRPKTSRLPVRLIRDDPEFAALTPPSESRRP